MTDDPLVKKATNDEIDKEFMACSFLKINKPFDEGERRAALAKFDSERI